MSFMVLKTWKTKAGFKAVVIKLDTGHNCGYVAVDKGHPLFGKGYNEHIPCLASLLQDVLKGKIGKRGILSVFCNSGKDASMDIVFNVHGSVTFARTNHLYPVRTRQKFHWIGFDCAHAEDNPIKCDLSYCVKECESLAMQIREIPLTHPSADGNQLGIAPSD